MVCAGDGVTDNLSPPQCRRENGNINFEKCMLLANLVSQVFLWKETMVCVYVRVCLSSINALM